ncbi:hypothetical protein DXG01_016062 [Tephrocybe rancida]|nr:hypothetical protein DXG01_016062 [Tephrocybe rancida]
MHTTVVAHTSTTTAVAQTSTTIANTAATVMPAAICTTSYAWPLPQDYAATYGQMHAACLEAEAEKKALAEVAKAAEMLITIVFWLKAGPPRYFKITTKHTQLGYFIPDEQLVLKAVIRECSSSKSFICVLTNYLNSSV